MIFCVFQTADKVIVYISPTSLMRINQKFCLSELTLTEKEFKTSQQSPLVLCIISTFSPVVRKYSKRGPRARKVKPVSAGFYYLFLQN